MVLEPVPPAVWPDWYRLLDDTERAAASRFVQEVDRRQYIAAHALTRTMLSRFTGIASADLRFVRGPHGKPAIHPDFGHSRLEFNLSHTRSIVGCAATLDHPIGIDVETTLRANFDLDIAESHFSPDEVERIRAAPPQTRHDVFFAIWTLKEAYVKAAGMGLGQPLDQFAVHLSPIRIAFGSALAHESGHWQFHALRPTAQSILSVAVRAAAAVRMDVRSVAHEEMGSRSTAVHRDPSPE